MKKYYAGKNAWGINVNYSSYGWTFLVFESKKARDEYVENNCYDRAGNVVTETVKKADIPGIYKIETAIVKAIDATNDYPAGCLGEIGSRYTGGYIVTDEI